MWGVLDLRVEEAKLSDSKRYGVTVSSGEGSYKSKICGATENPVFGQGTRLVVDKEDAQGEHSRQGQQNAHVSLFSHRPVAGPPHLVATADIKLAELAAEAAKTTAAAEADQVPEMLERWVPLLSAEDSRVEAGKLRVRWRLEKPIETQVRVWERLLHMSDADGSGELNRAELAELLIALGNAPAKSEAGAHAVFDQIDANHDGKVDAGELAVALGSHKADMPGVEVNPITGVSLEGLDSYSSAVDLTLAFDADVGGAEGSLEGGYLTEAQAARSWMFRLTDWDVDPGQWELGLNTGSKTKHIMVWDRREGRLREEVIQKSVLLSLRALYGSKVGSLVKGSAVNAMLVAMSREYGKKKSSPASAKEIPRFIKVFASALDVAEWERPPEAYTSFNDWFTRKLKPGARPIAEADGAVVSAADCRLIAFPSVSEATRLWVKGRDFSLAGMLDSEELAKEMGKGASVIIFRLAPQDYHRFHFPVSGKLVEAREVGKQLFTVNPIAINSSVNVLCENKRAVCVIETPDLGKVAVVCVGATLVGSIVLTASVGDEVQAGQEMGYFQFGGSTVVAVFHEGAIDIEADLLEQSGRSVETKLFMGEHIATTRKNAD